MIDLNTCIGKEVINALGKGTIVSVDNNYIAIKFGDEIKQFQIDAFYKGFLKFDDALLQKQLDDEIKAKKEVADKAAEERRIAAEIARQERIKKAEEEAARKKAEADAKAVRKNKGKKSAPIHPYIDERRKAGKPVIFLVCQNNNYDFESNHNFIWASLNSTRASHAEVEQVRKGDIIIHHFNNRIYALSVAVSDWYKKPAPVGHPNAGVDGRYVDCNYHFLNMPADTTGLKSVKISSGSMKYGPFEVTGKNKQGLYLSEAADDLAIAFMDAAIASNPNDAELKDFRNKI